MKSQVTNLQNDRFLKALKKEPTDCTPIWIMRQAGRYLPEYRATRKKAGDFLTLCKTPELACEVTLQPLERFELDAAILFSDILTIPDAMGLGLHFVEGEGPKFKKPLQDEKSIHAVSVPHVEESLSYVTDAVKEIQKALDGKVPLIGFSGSPWTLATYMVEGGSSKNFETVKKMLYARPDLMHHLLKTLSQSVAQYLTAQIEAGVQAVQIFDTWGGNLTTPAYQEFSLDYMHHIVRMLKAQPHTQDIPVILFTKHGGQWLEQIVKTKCDGVGIDWTVDISDARKRIGDKVCIQGNLDPCVLYTSPDVIEKEVKKIIDGFGEHPGHIFNLGHGIHPGIDPDNVKALVDSVHEFSKREVAQEA